MGLWVSSGIAWNSRSLASGTSTADAPEGTKRARIRSLGSEIAAQDRLLSDRLPAASRRVPPAVRDPPRSRSTARRRCGSRVAPEFADPVGPLEVVERQDVEELGAGEPARGRRAVHGAAARPCPGPRDRKLAPVPTSSRIAATAYSITARTACSRIRALGGLCHILRDLADALHRGCCEDSRAVHLRELRVVRGVHPTPLDVHMTNSALDLLKQPLSISLLTCDAGQAGSATMSPQANALRSDDSCEGIGSCTKAPMRR
jgi:hypothetical protein